MSTTPVAPAAEAEKPFDPKTFIARQNAAQAAKHNPPALSGAPAKPETPAPAKPAEAPAAASPAEETGEQASPRLSRSQRREHNRLLRELGEATGRAKALEELLAKTRSDAPAGKEAEAEAPADDPKPKEADFKDWKEFTDALSRWAARQETKKAVAANTESAKALEQYREHLRAMDEKAQEDKKAFADWDEVAKEASEDGPEWAPAEHPQLMALIASSDVKAYLLYYLAKNPKELEQMLELTKSPTEQIRQFHRLEGRLEKLYEKSAAQAAGDKAPKDRTNPEKAEQAGATAVDRDVHKPRPSAEVAARGGSSAPEEPAVGSAAWMARRNQTQFGK